MKKVDPQASNINLFTIRGRSLEVVDTSTEDEIRLFGNVKNEIDSLTSNDLYLTDDVTNELIKQCKSSTTKLTILYSENPTRPYAQSEINFMFLKSEEGITRESLVQHELGHIFGLDDEYVELSRGVVSNSLNCSTIEEAISGSAYWSPFVSSKIQLPSVYSSVGYYTGDPSSCFDGDMPRRDWHFLPQPAHGSIPQIAFFPVGRKELCTPQTDETSCMVKLGDSYSCLANGKWVDCLGLKNSFPIFYGGGCNYTEGNVRATRYSIMLSQYVAPERHSYQFVNEDLICKQLKRMLPSQTVICDSHSI